MTISDNSVTTKRVVIVGAGPAGLLSAILLLRRNFQQATVRYHIHLIDAGPDLAKVDDLSRVRSWMLAFSWHGIQALVKTVPGLFEDYVAPLGLATTSARFCYGQSKLVNFTLQMKQSDKRTEAEKKLEAMTIDRNYLCAALARFLQEHHVEIGNDKDITLQYETTALLVDAATKRVLVRPTIQESSSSDPTTDTEWIPYDVLLGCDGIRSVVRNAFILNHREFEFDLKGTFGRGKSVHLTLPKEVPEGQFMLLVECIPNLVAYCLPETGGVLNFACGYGLNTPCDEALFSDDAETVAVYFREHFTAFDMDFGEIGREWVKQPWGSAQQVHCNFYHSAKLCALLLGDAAHATSPQIGEGMNTALEDAACLNELLDQCKDDWEAVLPAFSELRVKEGNALTDLSFHTYSLSGWTQMEILVRQNVRRLLNRFFPAWLVEPEPMMEIPAGMKLSIGYDKMMQLGYFQKVRRGNEEIMRAHFERTVGMVTSDGDAPTWKGRLLQLVVLIVAIAVGFLVRNRNINDGDVTALQ